MDPKKVDMFLLSKGKFLPPEQLPYIKSKLEQMDDDSYSMMYALELKDPTISLVISIFLGVYGVDRLWLGDVGIGVGKLLTCGGFGIWAIIDWFLIMDATRKYNFERMCQFLTLHA